MSSKLNLNSILRFSNNGGKERKYDRADREITDRIIRVNMKYYIVYSIRIIIYFVDDMIYVLSIFSYFLSKKNVFLAGQISSNLISILFRYFKKKRSVSTFLAFHVFSSGSKYKIMRNKNEVSTIQWRMIIIKCTCTF